jgi:hypothetical protein
MKKRFYLTLLVLAIILLALPGLAAKGVARVTHPRRLGLRQRRDVRTQKSIVARGGLLAMLVLTLLALGLTGCGVGPATDQEKVSKTATTYLKALAAGDTATACAQLTLRAKDGDCETALRARLPQLDSDALRRAADASMDIKVQDSTATAGLSEPEGAHFLLVKVDGQWRIDTGYTLR